MHFSRLTTLTGLILCTLSSALASPAPSPAPIDSSLSTPVVQKNVYEYISEDLESLSSTNSALTPSSTSTLTSSAPESLSMMHPWSAGILAAAGVFATLL